MPRIFSKSSSKRVVSRPRNFSEENSEEWCRGIVPTKLLTRGNVFWRFLSQPSKPVVCVETREIRATADAYWVLPFSVAARPVGQ